MSGRLLPAALLLSIGALAGQAIPPTKQVPPPSSHAPANVSFADITSTAGLAGFRHLSGDAAKNYVMEVTGSGVAAFDYDNDGLADIYLLNGSSLDLLHRGQPAAPAALYRNTGDGTFRDVTAEAGVANGGGGQGVCVGDIDNDGDEDIYVTNFGINGSIETTPASSSTSPAPPGLRSTAGRPAAPSVISMVTDRSICTSPGSRHPVNNLPPSPVATAAAPVASASGPRQLGMGAAYSAGGGACTWIAGSA